MGKTLLGVVVDWRKLGRELKRLREEKGWTQGKMAQVTGKSKGAISQWERGLMPIGETALDILAEKFRTTPEDILTKSGAVEALAAPHRPAGARVEVRVFLMLPCLACGQVLPVDLSVTREDLRVLCCHCRQWNLFEMDLEELRQTQRRFDRELRALSAHLKLELQENDES